MLRSFWSGTKRGPIAKPERSLGTTRKDSAWPSTRRARPLDLTEAPDCPHERPISRSRSSDRSARSRVRALQETPRTSDRSRPKRPLRARRNVRSPPDSGHERFLEADPEAERAEELDAGALVVEVHDVRLDATFTGSDDGLRACSCNSDTDATRYIEAPVASEDVRAPDHAPEDG